jgi:PHS family inorganic phosphate transporter-like MFS transporter
MIVGMLALVYWRTGSIPEKSDTAIKVSTSAGTVIGQLGFGYLADVVGRKKMYGLELMIIIAATLAQSVTSNSASISIVGLLVFWRIIMGIGIGGDYPLSSIITSEFATTKWRGAMMGAVFAMQGLGQFAAALCALLVTVGFKQHLEGQAISHCDAGCRIACDKMWRIIIGVGGIPACIALYYRLTIPETPRYTFDVQRDVEKAAADAAAFVSGQQGNGEVDEISRAYNQQGEQLSVPKSSWSDFISHFGNWKNGKIIIGTAGSWLVTRFTFEN